MKPADGDENDQPDPRAQPDPQRNQSPASTRPDQVEGGGATFERRDASRAAGETFEQVGASTGQLPAETVASPNPEEAAAPAQVEGPGKSREDAGTDRHAFLVMAGILLSRVVGLVRQRAMAHYFGTTDVADAFNIALRIPNFLQNVFGEGALSASFIPVYAGLLADEEEDEADHVAWAVFSLLALTTSVIVLLGVLFTPNIISVIAFGYSGPKRDLTISLVRIFFPSTGLLVLSAWCLGVLNSHRRFFISYTAPVLWNLAIIFTLVFFGRRGGDDLLARLAQLTAWGSVAGSGLQLGIQLPTVLRLLRRVRPVLDVASTHVREVIRNFFPVFVSRGVVQISAFVDAMLASLLGEGAVAAIAYTQSLYTLPVSLFGMSVSAAELPAMSGARGSDEERAEKLRLRLDGGLKRIAFFIVPSAVAFLALGDVIVGVLYRSGRFTQDATYYVWAILAGSTVGLLASTLGRLYSSTYYALHDTRTPLVFAVIRVVLTTGLGYLCALPLPRALGLDLRWGAVGLTASAGVSGWVEFYLLRRKLNQRIGRTGLPFSFVVKLWAAALTSAAAGWAIKLGAGARNPFVVGALVLIPYGLLYFALAWLFGVGETAEFVSRLARPLRRLLR
jgi:putative peptidoglycan lipid II flippase